MLYGLREPEPTHYLDPQVLAKSMSVPMRKFCAGMLKRANSSADGETRIAMLK